MQEDNLGTTITLHSPFPCCAERASQVQRFTRDANIPLVPPVSLSTERPRMLKLSTMRIPSHRYSLHRPILVSSNSWKKSAWLTKLLRFRSMLCFIQISNTCKRNDSSFR